MTELNPAEWDTATYALMAREAEAQAALDRAVIRMHQMAGDVRSYSGWGRSRIVSWQLTDTEAQAKLVAMAELGDKRDLSAGARPSEILGAIDELEDAIDALNHEIGARESLWRQHRWSRWYPCLNADGHIHASGRGCKTVYHDTPMGWETSLSGRTVEEAIEALGPRLCSVCFPDAPVEHCRSLREINRAQREAEKAARAEAKFVKRLRDHEVFRDHNGYRVETVAACKQILRDEVELRDCYGHGEHPWHPASVVAAGQAKQVLLAREAASPGTGATGAEIARIIASAIRKNQKHGARLDDAGNVLA